MMRCIHFPCFWILLFSIIFSIYAAEDSLDSTKSEPVFFADLQTILDDIVVETELPRSFAFKLLAEEDVRIINFYHWIITENSSIKYIGQLSGGFNQDANPVPLNYTLTRAVFKTSREMKMYPPLEESENRAILDQVKDSSVYMIIGFPHMRFYEIPRGKSVFSLRFELYQNDAEELFGKGFEDQSSIGKDSVRRIWYGGIEREFQIVRKDDSISVQKIVRKGFGTRSNKLIPPSVRVGTLRPAIIRATVSDTAVKNSNDALYQGNKQSNTPFEETSSRAEDILKKPWVSQPKSQLLVLLDSLQRQFFADNLPVGYTYRNISSGFDSIRLYTNGADSAFLKNTWRAVEFGNFYGPNLDSKNQKFVLYVSKDSKCIYASNAFITLYSSLRSYQTQIGEELLDVKFVWHDFLDTTKEYSWVKPLHVGRHLVGGNFAGPPTDGYFREWVPGSSYNYYTLKIRLDSITAFAHHPLKRIEVYYRNGLTFCPDIAIAGINVQTYFNVNAPIKFSQGDAKWKDSIMGETSWDKISKSGCIVTFAAMAMRAIGLTNGPDGSIITPGTL
ncbi:MAG: hypothetical protein JW795_19120, partial [Chitinivibrionales bacterium]|nr:hypothetical protein [Chitinivibrionales bacterium]